MANDRKFVTRTPGEQIDPRQMPPQDPAPVQAEIPQAAPGGIDLSALSDDEVIMLAAEARRRAAQKSQPGELPDQSEIDPATIKSSVLTKQGWVVPIEKPHPSMMR